MKTNTNVIRIDGKETWPKNLFQGTTSEPLLTKRYFLQGDRFGFKSQGCSADTSTFISKPIYSRYLDCRLSLNSRPRWAASWIWLTRSALVRLLEKSYKIKSIERVLETDEHLILDGSTCVLIYKFSEITDLLSTAPNHHLGTSYYFNGLNITVKRQRTSYSNYSSSKLFKSLTMLSLKYKTSTSFFLLALKL